MAYVDQMDKNSPLIHYRLEQTFGTEESPQNIQEDDIITSIEFDQTGGFLAIGDMAGRIVVF